MKKYTRILFMTFLGIIGSSIVLAESENDIKKPVYIVKIIVTGGLCRYGECYSETRITQDGIIEKLEPSKGNNKKMIAKQSWLINTEDLKKLTGLINTTDYELIKANKFVGTCPTAYDGSEYTYVFETNQQSEVISTCKYAIDHNEPIFLLLSTLTKKQ